MFSQTGREINNLSQVFKNFGSNYALFNKSFANIGKDLKNGLGIRSFTNIVSKTDIENFNKFNNALNSGIGYSQAFKDHLSKSSTTIQRQAVEVQKLRIQQNILNTQRQTGKITEEQYSAAMTANKAKMQALTTQTQSLTLSQKAATVASKALAVGLNLISNVAFAIAINLIITGITKLVNKQKELRESISETAEEAKRQTDSLNSLIKSYEAYSNKIEYTVEEKEKLKDIQDQLSELYHKEVSDIDLVNGKYDEQIEKLKELKREKLKDAELSLVAEREQAKQDTANKNLTNKKFDIQSSWFKSDEEYNEIIQELDKRVRGFTTDAGIFADSRINLFSGGAEFRIKEIKEAMAVFKEYGYTNLAIYSKLNDLLSEYQGYVDAENEAISNLAQNIFQQYELDNPYKEVGKDSYLSWKNGLLDSAGNDNELRDELLNLAKKQFPDYTEYFKNLDIAREKFLSGRYKDTQSISEFLNNLSDEELEIAIQIPDLFDNGLDDALKKIREKMKNNPIELKVAFDNEEFDKKYEEATKAVSAFTSSQKDLNSALEEQKEHGQLSASTIQSLTDAGYAEALAIDKVTGAVTLNTEKYKELNNEKKKEIQLEIAKLKVDLINPYKEETTAIADLERSLSSLNEEERKATQIKIANMRANLANSNLTDEQRKQKEQQLADLEAMLASLDAPTFGDNTDTNKDEFDKLYSKWQHDLEMNKVTQEEYINWLDGAYKQYFSDLTKYESEYNKYEEEVYKARKDREQDLFDKKIENYKKLSDNALDDKITDFNVVDQKALDDLKKFNEEMKKAYGLGNVDLTKRPKVNSDTMRKAGYEVDDGGTATVYSSFDFIWQGDEENGKYVAVHYTPILPDGTVLDEKTLSDYLYDTLEGSQDILSADYLGVVLKVDTDLNISDKDVKSLETDKPTQNIQDIIKACDDWDIALHNVQEQWVELDNTANQSTTSYVNKFDYARSQINSAIAETQSRINELSLKTGFEDEIEELTSDLEGLYDTLEDINKKEIESQKEYIETLKNEYSDLMDEQIDQQKKLSEEIEKSYENRISAIDKQIDALKKVSEAEERQKSILEAEKDVKEAMLELDKAKTQKRLVYSLGGTWQLKEDKSAVDEAQKNLEDKQESLNEVKKDEQIAKLEEQKELLETQKDNSKEYYDKVVTDLEEQKTAREKQYDILVDIYEQLGGDKKQTSLNDSLVEKLTTNGDINKAVQGLTPTEMKQAITSGILTTDSNGNYAIDYSIIQKNEQAVKDNTAELEKLNNQLSGKSDTVDKNSLTYNNKNLDAEGYLIDANGKRVLNDGKPIHAKNFSAEIEKRKNNEKIGNAVGDIGKFAGYGTMKGLLNAIMTGEYTVPTSTANSLFNQSIQNRVGSGFKDNQQFVNNDVTTNPPAINFTVNVEGSADEKTIQAMKTEVGNALLSYTDKLISSVSVSSMRRQNQS